MANASNGPVRSPGGEETGSKISGLPQSQVTSEQDACTVTWGFTLDQLYKMATAFFKEHEGKAFHISYEDKVNLVAYTLQVTHGKYNPERCKPLGYLDVVGRDRRQAWISLGDTDRETAMKKFIELLNLKCPLFRPFVEAHKADMEEKERKRQEEEEERRREQEEELERQRLEEEVSKQEQERQRQLEQKRLIQEALNRQTYHQFKAYAEQQFPGNPEQQGVLIRQLQEQHYHQYMQQVLNQQQQQQQQQSGMADGGDTADGRPPADPQPVVTNGGDADTKGEEGDSSGDEESTEEGGQVMPSIATASMWTRKDIKEFKEGIRKEGSNGILKVGHGEVVTVRVPTHPNGNCLFWEFATDSYDLGFGIYFEWTAEPGNQMSVHVSESEEEDEEEEEERSGEGGDVEKGSQGDPHNLAQQSSMSLVIPVFRRDCHEEVYAGSHLYPGQGVYLLKFDNSYSLWRSKTLYYRVYYTR
ncbi:Golgi resident protein GCP60 [Rhipicephalus sanguineus]|uniref:Golgi resident protein GCP60 n=1 Tax=Rhipicephalus sanguineus TaxID=34632 RepID=UPI0018945FD9|nr:Golgi resident protein GCP60 [Rhipicephalus sanguineus]